MVMPKLGKMISYIYIDIIYCEIQGSVFATITHSHKVPSFLCDLKSFRKKKPKKNRQKRM